MTTNHTNITGPYRVSYRTRDIYDITINAASETEARAKAEALWKLAPELFDHEFRADGSFEIEATPFDILGAD
ncbi:hypothetical protein QE369_000760 [Agrobacterium larrymoorei]|uniref:Uncharacterized protein n=1 Tax=Agrobacterium larrymoorei TaxID=160699 RepID=A0AAJ2B8W5_9HYPH|nr:hypothetical protein [Agrobacterium larrymoorei]MDR6100582.1 hypothetical protein [Agrobacterium larrymoorei]